ncbi:hypothetical protein KC19_VG032400 [Ceratodon purpureus]|uniref:Uncharacterized protein n=1 Tax=Ceratodon purpureus TaxID=3225 RepID=A0A8T0HLH4_CERPU|nr:hypothetical protein KC19_VG032400 [Ceratodon purpureus]
MGLRFLDAVMEVYEEFVASKQKNSNAPRSLLHDIEATPRQTTQVSSKGLAWKGPRSRKPRLLSKSPYLSSPSWAEGVDVLPNIGVAQLNSPAEGKGNRPNRGGKHVDSPEEYIVVSSDECHGRRSR